MIIKDSHEKYSNRTIEFKMNIWSW